MFVVQTPPYLTALPEISYHRLTARDKFMVIGSDGLWDMMTPMQVLKKATENCFYVEIVLFLL
jgi:pyruvate dehydrogenase phosphatase